MSILKKKHDVTSKSCRINTHESSVTLSELLVILCHIKVPLTFLNLILYIFRATLLYFKKFYNYFLHNTFLLLVNCPTCCGLTY